MEISSRSDFFARFGWVAHEAWGSATHKQAGQRQAAKVSNVHRTHSEGIAAFTYTHFRAGFGAKRREVAKDATQGRKRGDACTRGTHAS